MNRQVGLCNKFKLEAHNLYFMINDDDERDANIEALKLVDEFKL